MPRQPKEITLVHRSADYYEPLFRARFVRAMKSVQKQTSINALALSMASLRHAASQIPKEKLEEALTKGVKTIIRDAFMQGGKLGAEHVRSALNG